MNRFGIFVLFCSTLYLACTHETLDGGSNSEGTPSDASPSVPDGGLSADSSSGGDPSDGLPTTAFATTIMGDPFTPTAFELRESDDVLTLEIHNASTPCAIRRGTGEDVVIVTTNIGGGVSTLHKGQISIQRGSYMLAEFDSSAEGRIRLDEWPGAIGTKVTGTLRIKGDKSELSGVFAATLCSTRPATRRAPEPRDW